MEVKSLHPVKCAIYLQNAFKRITNIFYTIYAAITFAKPTLQRSIGLAFCDSSCNYLFIMAILQAYLI